MQRTPQLQLLGSTTTRLQPTNASSRRGGLVTPATRRACGLPAERAPQPPADRDR